MATSFQLIYENEEQLIKFIADHELAQYPTLLIQAYVSQMEDQELHTLRNTLLKHLPKAKLIGGNSRGEIIDGRVSERKPILTFTVFDKTNIHSNLFTIQEDTNGFQLGQTIVKELVNSETKVLIILASHHHSLLNEVLSGIYEWSPDIHIVGGVMAEEASHHSFIVTQQGITSHGIAVASLDNQNLYVKTMVNADWQEIGSTFTVTKSKNQRIYEIDGKKPVQVLKTYLGQGFIDRLPYSGLEFPLLIHRNGKQKEFFIKRTVDFGGIQVSDSIFEGEEITFAIPNIERQVNSSIKQLKNLKLQKIDSVFVFHSITRMKGIEGLTQFELQSLAMNAPVSGVFCNGEIAKRQGEFPQIFSHSMSYLAFSEAKEKSKMVPDLHYHMPDYAHTFVTLSNLINASSQDIKALNNEMKISEEQYRSLFNNNTDMIYSTDLRGNFTSMNPVFLKNLGYAQEELLGKSALKLVQEADVNRIKRHFHRTIDGKPQYYDIEIYTKNGKASYYHIKNIPITVNNECVGIYGIGRDITENLEFEKKITQLANYDEETGLPNRNKFKEIIDRMLERAKKKKRTLAVLFVDFNRFNMINDALGHDAGDLFLKEMAVRIKNCLLTGAYVGRFGSDKFTILLTKNSSPEYVTSMCKLLLEAIQLPFKFQDKEFFITASIGVSMYPYDGYDSDILMKNADIALNRAKLQGGNEWIFFSDEMNDETIKRLELESDLRRALKNNELYLLYQPIVEKGTRKLITCEALIRWQHPQRGIVPPLEFIPIAEETGLIHSIGKWVLKTACKQVVDWHNEGLTDVSISINVSAFQFQNRWFIEEVKNALAYSGLHPNYLHLELTETVMLNDSQKTIEVMKALTNIGVKISIDDFGTGYSSLSYLKNLPIHILKIDRSFIQNLDVNTPDFAIVKSIMTMGHGLGLQVTAEGIETTQQLEILEEMNCDFLQGYFIEKPLFPDQLKEWLNHQHSIMI